MVMLQLRIDCSFYSVKALKKSMIGLNILDIKLKILSGILSAKIFGSNISDSIINLLNISQQYNQMHFISSVMVVFGAL